MLADLRGRRAGREVVGQLLAGARAGRSAVLVVRGEAGIGRSAVLEQVRDTAVKTGFRVERTVGVGSETQFAFAGLHQLCAPLMDRAGAPPPLATAPSRRAVLRGGPVLTTGARDAPA